MAGVWQNKAERAANARTHKTEMELKFSQEIKYSVDNASLIDISPLLLGCELLLSPLPIGELLFCCKLLLSCCVELLLLVFWLFS